MDIEAWINKDALERTQSLITRPIAPMIEQFFDDVAGHISAIGEKIATSDMEGVSFAAHTIKSPSESLGASQLCEAARTLEASAESYATHQDIERVATDYTHLQEMMEKTQAAYRAAGYCSDL
ncbi:MAG: Hpt domain-containing protein [Sphaerospermopsis sp. SIO1G2]|nr:Hpt domain-containing protein [Sphaerospermopsis sp. SIO1G2]